MTVRALLATVLLGTSATAAAQAVPSPHASADDCAVCHVSGTDGVVADQFQHGSADATCLTCHEDTHHAVGLTPAHVTVPAQMPLDGGKLACFSCHDEPSCDARTEQEAGSNFYRGGPFGQIGELCAVCHVETGQERYNPHQAMAAAPTSVEPCTFCHVTVPEGDTSDLRVDDANTCQGCHPSVPHAGAAAHLRPLHDDVIALASAAGLPLAGGTTVVCLTCHDPHPAGRLARTQDAGQRVGQPLFPAGWVEQVLQPALTKRDAGAVAITAEQDFLRRPITNGELCMSCHTPASIEALRRERGR